jgi:uncharacterized protein (DUF362 family)
MAHDGQTCGANCANNPRGLDRRSLLLGTAAAAAGLAGAGFAARWFRRSPRPVFVARNQRYDGPLAATIRDGLLATGLDPQWLRGRRVLLKPNLVEPSHDVPQRTTHPAVVAAAAGVFSGWGATVAVGEGPGHVRDTEMALAESGMQGALAAEHLPFEDFNYDEIRSVANGGGNSPLREFFFPSAVLDADLVVSIPKLKTHHWVGMTAAMKNLYGTLPGLVYGWPKNVLHHAGIPETVVDISASLPKTIAIVDAILCMEGDGPILGTPKPLGLLAIGTNPAAVDATCARIMALDPSRIGYLAIADGHLGPIRDAEIVQRGERWQELVDPFQIIDQPHIQSLRAQV